MRHQFGQHGGEGRLVQGVGRIQEHQVPQHRVGGPFQERFDLGAVHGDHLAGRHRVDQVRVPLADGAGLGVEFDEVHGLGAAAAALHPQ